MTKIEQLQERVNNQSFTIAEYQGAVTALEAALKDAAGDARLLDWLERHITFEVRRERQSECAGDFVVLDAANTPCLHEGKTLRDAIRAAIARDEDEKRQALEGPTFEECEANFQRRHGTSEAVTETPGKGAR